MAKGCGQNGTTVYVLTAWVDVSEVYVYCVACSAQVKLGQVKLMLRKLINVIVISIVAMSLYRITKRNVY